MPGFLVDRIVSGGQTGVDRAALDLALELGIRCGGWCPRGRKAEDGPLPSSYPLKETPSAGYEQRTEWNVRDSDGTLVLARGKPSGGTALTLGFARRLKKPCLVVDLLKKKSDLGAAAAWIAHCGIGTLNVAGPRESLAPGSYLQAKALLREILAQP